jgi:FtsP/CotA-like multicopper oxidase with cupredoxin domain
MGENLLTFFNSMKKLPLFIALLGVSLLTACQTSTNKTEDEEVTELPLASSTSIVELADGDTYNLEASFVEKEIDGSVYKMLAYNGSIPGPTLKVQQGSTITVNFTNNTDIETTLHSHGVRLDNAFDGVPDVTQQPIQTGESFTYQMRFDDAGVFWYHPHLREDYAQDMGLYGNYIVVSGPEDEWSPVNREETLIVDDILVEDGSIVPYSLQEVTHTLMGRFGNTMLANGSTDYSLDVNKGEVLRFYITNTANTRVFNLSIPGAQMKLVGADNGLYERDQWADEVLLGPSERAIVEVLFAESGEFALVHKTPEKTYTMGSFLVSEEEVTPSYASDFNTLKTHQSTIASIDPYRDSFSSEPDKFLTIDLDMKSMGGMHSMHGGGMMEDSMMSMSDGEPIEWEDTMDMMNSTSNTDTLEWQLIDEKTEKANEAIDDWDFKQGDLVKIRITNPDDTMHPMQHPIHIHGQRFLVLSTDGEFSDNLVWKDTTLIPAGSTVELLVEMSNPGEWMLHCHIPEHLESGMMAEFNVSNL